MSTVMQTSGMTTAREGTAVLAVTYLSGDRRGRTERLNPEGSLRIGTRFECEIRPAGSSNTVVSDLHALLHSVGDGYALEVMPGQHVWVNGERVRNGMLAPGDMLEIGPGGPTLRLRSLGSTPYKSMDEAFSDCLDCARQHRGGPLVRGFWLMRYILAELSTQVAPLFRLVFLVMLIAAILLLTRYNWMLDSRLVSEARKLEEITEVLEQVRISELAGLRGELLADLQQATQRIESLEARSEATHRVIAEAAAAVVFLQGSYGFVDVESGRPLRHRVDSGNRLIRVGRIALTLEGDGPLFESEFTGTGFVIDSEGLILTNRHVAMPWEFDHNVQTLLTNFSFRAVPQRFIGYLPGRTRAFEVHLLHASDETDLALLRGAKGGDGIPHLQLSDEPARPGDEVIVLGYPAGLGAMLVRLDEAQLDEIRRNDEVGFWDSAERLAGLRLIKPLANRGIVGQISAARVVYDAPTTRGGSGGPVLNMRGQVVAINAATMKQFDGSNLGIPAAHARRMIARVNDVSLDMNDITSDYGSRASIPDTAGGSFEEQSE